VRFLIIILAIAFPAWAGLAFVGVILMMSMLYGLCAMSGREA